MDTVRGLLFGSVAERYEQYRSGYPDELVDVVQEWAGRPIRTALEVGAGTGKATRVFASRGIAVTAIEPDAAMAAVLARVTSELPVQPVVTSFEQYDGPGGFDLVLAAAAWHWTRPADRWTRAVSLLDEGGVLAVVAGGLEPADPETLAALKVIEERRFGAKDTDEVYDWSLEEMAAVPGLADAEERELPLRGTGTAEGLVGMLGTVSAYLRLPPAERAAALEEVRAVLPDVMEMQGTLQVCLARRVSP